MKKGTGDGTVGMFSSVAAISGCRTWSYPCDICTSCCEDVGEVLVMAATGVGIAWLFGWISKNRILVYFGLAVGYYFALVILNCIKDGKLLSLKHSHDSFLHSVLLICLTAFGAWVIMLLRLLVCKAKNTKWVVFVNGTSLLIATNMNILVFVTNIYWHPGFKKVGLFVSIMCYCIAIFAGFYEGMVERDYAASEEARAG